jgi:RimJ/RimL family protein N-acetyltransferase
MLRALTLEDMEPIRKWRNASLDTLRTPFELTKEMQEDWYHGEICNRASRSRFWAIEDSNGVLIGYGGIENIQWENSIGEISLLIAPGVRGQGYGYMAAYKILERAFSQLNLKTVYAEVYESNPAIKFWDKVFFDDYKTKLPNRKYINGLWHDSRYYSRSK